MLEQFGVHSFGVFIRNSKSQLNLFDKKVLIAINKNHNKQPVDFKSKESIHHLAKITS